MARTGCSIPGYRRPALAALAALATLVLGGQRASGGGHDWVDVRVAGPFVLHADFPLHAVTPLFDDLARLQQDLVRLLAIRPAQERIEVYLFGSRASYDAFVRQFLPDVPYRRALYVKNAAAPGMVLAHKSGQLGIDLRHECTHALLHASLPMIPLWLDEGLAEYFEVEPERRALGNPHATLARFSAFWGRAPDLARLENKADVGQMSGSDYRNAWAWVHFMLHGPPEAHDELVRFLRDIQSETPPGRLSQRLARRLGDPASRWVAHFRNWDHMARTTSLHPMR